MIYTYKSCTRSYEQHRTFVRPHLAVKRFSILKAGGIRQVSYVPDAGHAHVIRCVQADLKMRDIVLTTEEEGVALVSGAWLGGQRAVLLMDAKQQRWQLREYVLAFAKLPVSVFNPGHDAR